MTCSSVFSLQSSLSFSVLWTPCPLPMERVVRRVNHLDFNKSPLACHDVVIFVQFFFPSREEDICAFFFFKSRAPKSKQTPLILISQKKKKKQNYCPLLLLPTMCSLPIELSSSHFGPLITTTKQTKLKGVQNNNNNNIKGCGRITI